MTTLRRKLGRDLWRLRHQGVTIAILVGCGIASFVAAVAASASLRASRDTFYASARFGDVFDHLQHAPRAMVDRLSDLPGVAAVDGRITDDYRLDVDGSAQPVAARFVSLPWPADAGLNQIRIRAGRLVQPGSADEVVISEAFSEAAGLAPGSHITAVINERRAQFRVVGVAVSPDFLLVTVPRTGLPDANHFGIVWMDGDALAKATDLDGAFNDVTLQLAAGADVEETIRRVDQMLEPYGGLGAVGRADQASAKFLEQKILQLDRLATSLPLIFLGVAAFLLNVLLSRIVGAQREQIATLKALGYRTRELALHYLGFAAVICAAGVAVGIGLGILAAHAMLAVYAQYFKFPGFVFRFQPSAIVGATVVAFAAGIGGTLFAVRKAVTVPPAEAMHPEPPASYRPTFFDRWYRAFSPVMRMVLRDAQRQPVRLVLSAGSIALATAIVLSGGVFTDSINTVLHLQFEVAHREQIAATLDQARPWEAVSDASHLPGVTNAEGERVVPVRLRAGPRGRTTAILGLQPDADMHRLLGANTRPLMLPSEGLSLSRVLADSLGLRAGDDVEVDVLEGDRRMVHVPVASLVDDLLGLSGYMDARALSEMLDEAPRVNVIMLAVAAPDIDAVTNRLNALPSVASVSRPDLDRGLVRAEVASELSVLSLMLDLFAGAIAVGVVYNNARIALETRSRNLATMRILGFTRGELGAVLLGEQAIHVVSGIPVGLFLGRAIGRLTLSSVDPELLRVPLTLTAPSYVAAVSVVVLAALASALLVRRRSDRLDLVAVLKARD
ncbi:MAG TPA: ABC transporter permease [Gemmatimonadaceae bacterium]|nr:ABC transporter permease [Gemmatimonadaceae bacterium]